MAATYNNRLLPVTFLGGRVIFFFTFPRTCANEFTSSVQMKEEKKLNGNR